MWLSLWEGPTVQIVLTKVSSPVILELSSPPPDWSALAAVGTCHGQEAPGPKGSLYSRSWELVPEALDWSDAECNRATRMLKSVTPWA